MSDNITVVRTFPVEITEGDGRTLDVRIVPYNTEAVVVDPFGPAAPRAAPYRETWDPGVFDRQLKAANRVKVLMNFEHQPGLAGVIGHGLELTDHQDGVRGSFRIHDNSDGEKALELYREGILTGVSLEAKPLKNRVVNGVMHRVKAHLSNVALVREPAYEDAQVLAVREASLVEEFEPVQRMDSELVERLARLGINIDNVQADEAQELCESCGQPVNVRSNS